MTRLLLRLSALHAVLRAIEIMASDGAVSVRTLDRIAENARKAMTLIEDTAGAGDLERSDGDICGGNVVRFDPLRRRHKEPSL